MPPDERDTAYLSDMLEHARLAMKLTERTSFHEYAQDRFRQLALERLFEIIGEAARRITVSFQQEHPEILWRKIISKRNVLAHEYDEILQELLWKTATEDLPDLAAAIEKILPPPPRS